MGRPPIGKAPMSSAERVRRHREKLRKSPELERELATLKGWTPFERGVPITMPDEAELIRSAKQARVSVEEMRAVYADMTKDVIYLNSRYQVNTRLYRGKGGAPDVVQLSIKRRDRQRVGPERYRDFLRIKNELVGPLNEAFELYPSMERNVDTANQYYVWCFADPKLRMPVGFRESRMTCDPLGGSINEPFEPGDLTFEKMGVLT